MWRKIIPTLLILVVLGVAVMAWLRLGTAEECDKWASIALRKARISYAALRGPTTSFEAFARAMYERDSFRIDGTLYENPGGCESDLLPDRLSPQP